jgi:hypothetical protein
MTGGEEGQAQGGEPLVVAQGRIPGAHRCRVDLRCNGFTRCCRQYHARDFIVVMDGGCARDEVAEGVAQDDRGPVGEGIDNRRDIAGHVVEPDCGHRTRRAGDATWLRAQHPVTCLGQRRGQEVEISSAVASVGREYDDGWAVAVDVGLDGNPARGDDLALPGHYWSVADRTW